MSRMIDGKGLIHFVVAGVFIIVAAGCAQNKNLSTRSNGPRGTFGNGSETRDYVEDIGFTADTGYRAPYGATTLLFLPRDKGHGINWQAALTSGHAGDVVAQVINVGNADFTEGNFTLKPDSVAYLWVGEVMYQGVPTRGYGVYKLNNDGIATGEWSVYPKSKIKWCRNNANRRRPSIKDKHPGQPSECEDIGLGPSSTTDRLASLGTSTAFAAPAPSASMALAGIGGLWISCAGGCCQISAN